MLTFLAIAERERPKWIVWENVPGVLSSNGGRDFGTFLAALGELGYGWAYRVLDAQWFGVAQRRRRVFVVGCLGDQAGAAAVLFESESVQRNPAPSREKGQGAAGGVIPSVAGSLDTECGGGKLTHQSVANGHIIGTITARMFNSLGARDVEEGALLPVAQPVAYGIDGEQNASEELIGTLRSHQSGGYEGAMVAQPVAHALRGEGFDASEDGTGRGTPIVPVVCATGDRTHALTTRSAAEEDGTGRGTPIVPVAQPVAFHHNAQASQLPTDARDTSISDSLTVSQQAAVAQPVSPFTWRVRRLTPTECERLQGFPDGYTAIPIVKPQPIKGQPAVVKAAADGPRYKALGNSMAVPCMKWIGERIQAATARQEVQP